MRKGIVLLLTVLLVGCQASLPKDAFKPEKNALALRALQTRSFHTTNEKKILSASALALQDMGFTLDESETKLGLIVASKEADATDHFQTALMTTSLILGALSGSPSSADYGRLDDIQRVKASLVTHVNPSTKSTLTRVTFQRVIWNKNKQVSRVENLNDQTLYQDFFEKISKSTFLEEHQI